MKTNPIVIKISDYTATNLAVAADEGEKVYQTIVKLFSDYQTIVLDFSGIALLTTAYLNGAIGQLYKDYSSRELGERLKLKNVSQDVWMFLFCPLGNYQKKSNQFIPIFSQTFLAIGPLFISIAWYYLNLQILIFGWISSFGRECLKIAGPIINVITCNQNNMPLLHH